MCKTVLITGSSRGIGREIAIYLAKKGFDIVLHYNKNLKKVQEVQENIKSLGQKARILCFDIKNRQQAKEVLLDDIEKNGIYYGIVLNAGIAMDNPFPAMEDDEWDTVINTNLNGFYNTLKPLILPMIQKRKGRIEYAGFPTNGQSSR